MEEGMFVRNPFKPTAGVVPPRLIGRDAILRDFVEGLDNGNGAPGRLMRISGMRGTGKTVMLRELCQLAQGLGWAVVSETALPGLTARIVDGVLPGPAPGAASVRSSLSLGPLSVEGEAALPAADGVTALRRALATRLAAPSRPAGVLIAVDEVQDAVRGELSEVAVAVQHAMGEGADVAFLFAGLPSMVDGLVNGRTLTFLRRAVDERVGLVGAAGIDTAKGKD